MTTHRMRLMLALASILIGVAEADAESGTAADPQIESTATGVVIGEELTSLANEVNLWTWTQLARSRDLTAIEESWVVVYSPKDPVGVARDWGTQVKRARSLNTRTATSVQKRWLGLFIKAGEAVERKDTAQFTVALHALEDDIPAKRTALAALPNFFTAK